ncbi:MAG: hypothetical protein P8M34_10150, partial [Saprospiraceae bacterium]|nr:hypothetical protein [Saprospiraceae bacterium]
MAPIIVNILISLLLNINLLNEEKAYTYHAVSIKKGDGMYSLLRRYNLNHSECNIDHFYELNGLKKNSYLHAGKKYKLPVYIYTYDSKSIRSTIGIQDWDKAVRIKEYNDDLLSRGLRKTDYKESKILWVPHNEISCVIKDEPEEEIVQIENKVTEEKEESYRNVVNEIYGNKYKDVAILDNSLYGKVFYVVSGHGGPDPGAVCKSCENQLCEDEYAYDVALRLA